MSVAILTMQHNEKWFLPLWIKYYKNVGDLFIIDHSSDRQWMKRFEKKCNIFYEDYKFFFNHQYMLDRVEHFYELLLREYDFVIYAEPDEFLIHKDIDLKSMFEYLDDGTYRPYGHDVVSFEGDKSLNFKKPILQQRQHWIRRPVFDKPTISSQVVKWEYGFHECDLISEHIKDLYLVHLHRVDYNKNWMKTLYQSYLPRETNDIEIGYGKYNALNDKNVFNKQYYLGIKEEIPAWIKERL